jgi:hypothetical protein
MIEKRRGFETLDEILKVLCIDTVQLGPGDYGMSIGKTNATYAGGLRPEVKKRARSASRRPSRQASGPVRKYGGLRGLTTTSSSASRTCSRHALSPIDASRPEIAPWCRSRMGPVFQAGQPLARVAPAAHRARHRAKRAGDRARRAPLCRQQHNARPKHLPLFACRRAQPSLKHRALFRRQPDLRCLGCHPDRESRISHQR